MTVVPAAARPETHVYYVKAWTGPAGVGASQSQHVELSDAMVPVPGAHRMRLSS